MLIVLCVLALWMTAVLVVALFKGDLLDFGSGDASSGVGSLTGVVVIVVLLFFTLKEILKRWPEVMEERRRNKSNPN